MNEECPEASSTALPGCHDFDVVTGTEMLLRPVRLADNASVDGHGHATRFFRIYPLRGQQIHQPG